MPGKFCPTELHIQPPYICLCLACVKRPEDKLVVPFIQLEVGFGGINSGYQASMVFCLQSDITKLLVAITDGEDWRVK